MTENEAEKVRIEEPETRIIRLTNAPCYNASRGYSMALDIAEIVSLNTNKAQMRKILNYIARHSYDVVPAQEDIYDELIQTWIKYTYQSLHDTWESTSMVFRNGYVDTKCGHTIGGRTVAYMPEEKKRINASNKRLYRDVVSAKNAYERYKDRLSIWNEVKAKYPKAYKY